MELRDIKEYFDPKFDELNRRIDRIEATLESNAVKMATAELKLNELEIRTSKRPTLECESFFKQHITSDAHIEYIKQKHREVHEEWDRSKKDEMRSNASFIKNIISIIQVIVPIAAVMIMVLIK
jgi:hypothetical protein